MQGTGFPEFSALNKARPHNNENCFENWQFCSSSAAPLVLPDRPQKKKRVQSGSPPPPSFPILRPAPKEIGSGPILHDPLHFPIPTQKEERRGGSETFPEGQGEAHRIPTFYGEAERRKFKAIFRGRGLLGG